MAQITLSGIRVFTNLWSQTKGLIGEPEPADFGSGIALPGVNSIHTFFVGYPIDVIFLDANNKVKKLLTIKPFRVSPVVFGTKTTLELKVGSIEKLKIKKGDLVKF
jgi:uncharacterized protein